MKLHGTQIIRCFGVGLATTGCVFVFGYGIAVAQNYSGHTVSVHLLVSGGSHGVIPAHGIRVSFAATSGSGVIAMAGSSLNGRELAIAPVRLIFTGSRAFKLAHDVGVNGITVIVTDGERR